MLYSVLLRAEEVTFSQVFWGDDTHLATVERIMNHDLRRLTLPSYCIYPTFLVVLGYEYPQLESLAVDGTLVLGRDPVYLRHDDLKILKFYGNLPEKL